MYGQCGVLIITLITRLWGESSGRYELTTVCLSVCLCVADDALSLYPRLALQCDDVVSTVRFL